jgi:hypothetical protein
LMYGDLTCNAAAIQKGAVDAPLVMEDESVALCKHTRVVSRHGLIRNDNAVAGVAANSQTTYAHGKTPPTRGAQNVACVCHF